MIWRAVVLVVLVGSACAVVAQEKDPVREKLLTAKSAYESDRQQYLKGVDEWLDRREDAARKDGDKKLVDQIKAERKAFEDDGELPKSAPTALVQKPAQAKKALEGAYAEAYRAYTKANREEAALVEEEWYEFHTKPTSHKPGSIDLLALIDPKAHAVRTEWKMDGKALIGIGRSRNTFLQIPYEPGEEYDIEVACKRVEGDDCVGVGLVAGGRQVRAVFDAWPARGAMSGLDHVDGKDVNDNATTLNGPQLKNDKGYTLGYSVRNGKIDMSIDGKVMVSYKGEFNRLSMSSVFRTPSDKALILFVGPRTTCQIDRITLTPVKGKGTIVK